MTRSMAFLVSLAFVLLTVAVPDVRGNVAMVSVAVVALLVSAVGLRAGRDHRALFAVSAPRRAASDERCLHGAFRRLSSPDTPGCPRRPRAPGFGPLPA